MTGRGEDLALMQRQISSVQRRCEAGSVHEGQQPMENPASRTPQETFQAHGEALRSEDLDRILENFTEDAVFITAAGVKRGREGVREAFAQLIAELPRARWDLRTKNFGGDILYLEWAADSDANRAVDGVDTFVFRDGLIQAMTVRYTLVR